MARRIGGPWLKVGKVIELFVAMGCTLGEVPGLMHGPHGSWRVRYLYNPDKDDFVPLSDLADDEYLSPTELANWERRLGVVIPKGDDH